MSKKQKKFADDGWAVWVDGADTSTVYLNNWLNPKGKSYVDLAVRIRGVKSSRALYVYVPFAVSRDSGSRTIFPSNTIELKSSIKNRTP